MKEETVIVCAECSANQEIEIVGGDSLNYCPACRTIEGETEEITQEEYEQRL